MQSFIRFIRKLNRDDMAGFLKKPAFKLLFAGGLCSKTPGTPCRTDL